MRFSTAGEVRRTDLGVVMALLAPLHNEWAQLHFDEAGGLVNPLTGQVEPALTLIDGEHRQPGARYRIVDQGAGSETEPESPVECVATLLEDTTRQAVFTFADINGNWSADVLLEHSPLPLLFVTVEVDITALMKAEGAPGCLASLLGGKGSARVRVDLGPLERGGKAVDVTFSANRFRGSGSVDLRAERSTWEVKGKAELKARGLARPVLWFGAGRIRRHVNDALDEMWATVDGQVASLEADLKLLSAAIEAEGGPEPFVHRSLWDPDFDPDLPDAFG